MDFAPSDISRELGERLSNFLVEEIYPAETEYENWRQQAGPSDHRLPPVVERLKGSARRRGLWNLFLPAVSGLTVTDYAPLAELTGRSPILAPEALNCSAPDTGNMELLHMFATDQQRRDYLEPLLEGQIRSGFAMTEPDVASSDATNIRTRIERDGDEFVITGRKWWTTGASDPRCTILIVMGVTDPDAEPHHRHSMVLVPTASPGLTRVRDLTVFGYSEQHGHGEFDFDAVRVPAANLLGEQGEGFAMAQARLGPGRIHHCMRAIGMAERALELACRRIIERRAFGGPISDQGVVREQIALSRIELDQVRLLVHKTAWLIDTRGARAAATEIAAIKVAAPRAAQTVIDRAIQLHGAAGVGPDTPLAEMWAAVRTLRIADGPDEVHLRSVGRRELRRYAAR